MQKKENETGKKRGNGRGKERSLRGKESQFIHKERWVDRRDCLRLQKIRKEEEARQEKRREGETENEGQKAREEREEVVV